MPLLLPARDSALWLALTALAVWRLTALLCYEAGPFEAATRLRKAMVRVGLGRLVACFHCSAFWVSVIVVGVVYEWTRLTPLVIIAVAGAASIAERWLRGGNAEEMDDG